MPKAQVVCCQSPLEALKLMAQRQPDLVITDVYMPDMNGLEFLQKARECGCRRHVLLTGYDEFEIARQAIRLRSMDYLLKPVNKAELLALLDAVEKETTQEVKEQQHSAFQARVATYHEPAEYMCEFEKQLEQWLSAPAVNMLARLEELQPVWTAIGKRTPKWSLALFLADYPRDAALEDRIRYIHRGIVCSSSLSSGCSSQIAAAVAYIEERYAQELSLTVLSNVVHVQSSHLSAAFHRETGMRLTQYINEVRIGEACDLPMADPGCSLEELSEQVGIRNHPYFFKLFKNTTGMTPRDFCDRMIAVYGKKV